jgi:hypothetical protein
MTKCLCPGARSTGGALKKGHHRAIGVNDIWVVQKVLTPRAHFNEPSSMTYSLIVNHHNWAFEGVHLFLIMEFCETEFCAKCPARLFTSTRSTRSIGTPKRRSYATSLYRRSSILRSVGPALLTGSGPGNTKADVLSFGITATAGFPVLTPLSHAPPPGNCGRSPTRRMGHG